MPRFAARNSIPILLLMLAGAVSAVQWANRDQPLLLGPLRLDALSLFWLITLLVGAAHGWQASGDRRAFVANMLLLVLAGAAVTIRSLPLLIGVYALLAVVPVAVWPRRMPAADASSANRPLFFARMQQAAALCFQATWSPLAASCLALGYGTLALHGVANYDDPSAGLAMGSFVFWFVLLAALAGLGARSQNSFQAIWLYPLVRLYSIGPWNTGWALAAVLFGGSLALWLAWRALRHSEATNAVLLALALAAFGLASSAGIAAGCFMLLIAAVQPPHTRAGSWWAVVAPLVATWMLIGAAVAGGIVALAGVAWVVALLLALRQVVRGTPGNIGHFGVASLALAIAAPLILLWLIEPVVGQLQGGLTPYGDLLIWPWVGIAFVNSAQSQVAVLPSLAVALLLVVLVALLYLLTRLRRTLAEVAQANAETGGDFAWLWAIIREEVPWLSEGQRSDPR